ncbi:MAG: hypothetical protein J0H19_25550 [Rhodospirillales bacterium]|nr:hypothetical protein [Rhodospirillales bacterium]MBN8929972.1 hypothetical protein [Rhodospirillales bacterium]
MAKPVRKAEKQTLVARWLEALQNNPVIAAVVVVGTCIGATVPVYSALPELLRQKIVDSLPFTRESKATNGWAFAGYLDKDHPSVWATGPFVDMVKLSAASERRYPIRIGDVVSPNKRISQTVVDFRTKKFENVLVPPPQMRSVIRPEDDYTGAKFEKNRKYTVADVEVASFPGHDAVVWLRLTPAE